MEVLETIIGIIFTLVMIASLAHLRNIALTNKEKPAGLISFIVVSLSLSVIVLYYSIQEQKIPLFFKIVPVLWIVSMLYIKIKYKYRWGLD